MQESGAGRPAVTVIVPFKGDDSDARSLVARLGRIAVGPGDAVMIVDNTPTGVLVRLRPPPPLAVIPATVEHSSYYARNVAAEVATTPWLLFLDSDCEAADPHLLDAYFLTPVDPNSGILAGKIVGSNRQSTLVARFSRSRLHLDQQASLRHPYRPYGATANLLVRRAVWEQLGGFCEGIRSTGDQDFCWRAGMAGWGLEYRDAAAVHHYHRERVRDLARQFARYGAGVAWLRRRHLQAPSRRPRIFRRSARSLQGLVEAVLTRQRDEAFFRVLDMVVVLSNNVGYLLENRPPRGGGPDRVVAGPVADVTVLAGRVPDTEDPHLLERVAELRDAGVRVRIEAERRPDAPQAAMLREEQLVYAEDDGVLRIVRAVGWLVATHPLRSAGHLGRRGAGPGARSLQLRSLAPVARRLARGSSGALHVAPGMDEKARHLARLLGWEGNGWTVRTSGDIWVSSTARCSARVPRKPPPSEEAGREHPVHGR